MKNTSEIPRAIDLVKRGREKYVEAAEPILAVASFSLGAVSVDDFSHPPTCHSL